MVEPSKRFDLLDRGFIVRFTFVLIIFAALVFALVYVAGLLSFPQGRIEQSISDRKFHYFAFALEYRERRMTMALTYRTFLTTLGFVVGMVLASFGGIFIIRNATMTFEAKVAKPTPQPGAGGDTEKPTLISEAGASLVTNSPGVVFLLGGVAVMALTQYLAIPIGAPEVFPSYSNPKCDRTAEQQGLCYVDSSGVATSAADPSEIATFVLRYCSVERSKSDETCQMMRPKFENLLKGN